MPRYVANQSNRRASAASNTRTRRDRITNEARTGVNHRGDYANSTAMRNANRSLTGQNFGTRD